MSESKAQGNTVHFSTRISRDLADQIEARAQHYNRSRNAEIVFILSKALENDELFADTADTAALNCLAGAGHESDAATGPNAG